MIKVEKQLHVPNSRMTLLCFDSDIPNNRFTRLVIDGKEYKPIIAYDIKNAYAIEATGVFEGKEVLFV